ncbi:MAG: TetR/AcrR family transcriptional regulator [Anaerolineae bacterium]|nr:TetR/AcrR family transcriptional regulator [Anaerolineae bacterium]
MAAPKNKRSDQTEVTHRKIVFAAYRLFVTEGYSKTTLPAIAKEAMVSLSTVRAIFGTKFMLLDALIKTYTRGDDSPSPLITRSWWQAILQEPKPVEQLRRYAKTVRDIHERTSNIYEIFRSATPVDVEVATLRKELNKGRLEDTRTVAVSLVAKDAVNPDLNTDKLQDILWTLGSSEIYRMMTLERHWSADDYELWLAQTLIASVLQKKFQGLL